MSFSGTFSGQGREGLPLLTVKSAPNNPAVKNVQLVSQYPFTYLIYNVVGTFLRSYVCPDGGAPFTVIVDLSDQTYPTAIGIDIVDQASNQCLNTIRNLQLMGGEVFNVVLTWPPDVPAANGYLYVGLGGVHQLVRASDLNTLIWGEGDVHIESVS